MDLVNETAWRENLSQVGRCVEVMFADGEGRKDSATSRMSGRARDNRLVHGNARRTYQTASRGHRRGRPHPGRHITSADAGLLNLRRTPGGDAWQERVQSIDAARRPVSLGLPTLGVPTWGPPVQVCG